MLAGPPTTTDPPQTDQPAAASVILPCLALTVPGSSASAAPGRARGRVHRVRGRGRHHRLGHGRVQPRRLHRHRLRQLRQRGRQLRRVHGRGRGRRAASRSTSATPTARPPTGRCDITVNGTAVADGAWPSPAPAPGPPGRPRASRAALNAGTNTVRATATTANGGPNLDSLDRRRHAAPAPTGRSRWSSRPWRATRRATIGGWSYPVGAVPLRPVPRLPAHPRPALPRPTSRAGSTGSSTATATSTRASTTSTACWPARLLVILHHETGQDRYRKAAKKIRDRLNTYPRTTDGGFWHADIAQPRRTSSGPTACSWSNPFLVEYGKEFGDSAYTDDEAAKQLAVYGSHLQVAERPARARLRRVEDAVLGRPDAPGSPPSTGAARSAGTRMATSTCWTSSRPTTRAAPRCSTSCGTWRPASSSTRTRRPAAGSRWSTRARRGDNWTETSCSSMYTYALSRGAAAGLHRRALPGRRTARLPGRAREDLARLATAAPTSPTSPSAPTSATTPTTSPATRATNDFHGLGAFLIMNEQLRGEVS